MSKQSLLIIIILLLGSWFIMVERQSFWEKMFILIGLVALFMAYRVLTGAPVDQIFAPLINYFRE